MDIAILGASGRVGEILIQEVLESSEDRLVACYVSGNSEYIGRSVDATDLQYEPLTALPASTGDVLIDFSTPAATMAALADIGARAKALVIGTTGFSPEEEARLQNVARQLPVMISANFQPPYSV